jgi:hypothetical protein
MAAQVLPITQSHFASLPSTYGTSMFSEYQGMKAPLARSSLDSDPSGHQSLQDDGYASYLSDPQVQPLYVSPRAMSAASSQRRTSHSPHAVMRQPPARNRTPIQHSRTGDLRARSHSRSELLLAYATESSQVSQPPSQPSMTVIPSQSAPTTPQIFPMPAYGLQEGAQEGYATGSGYFSSAMPPMSSPPTSEFAYAASEPQMQHFYSLGRSASHSAASGLGSLNPQETMYMTAQSHAPSQSLPSGGHSFPPIPTPLESTTGDLEIMSSRPKPQCWDHGCNGRQFSTFSNLLRHQREKSGSAMKAVCPYCGTEFTRTTARNGHMYGGKCKNVLEKAPSETSSTSGKDRN